MITWLIQIYIYLIIADVLLSWVPEVRRQNWAQMLHRITDVVQKPIREMLPKGMPFDPTPMIVIILLQMLMYLF
jgi:YggT family protein